MSITFTSLRKWLQQGSRSTWILFVSFTLLLFFKCVLFHWFACHSILISSIWRNPIAALGFYLPKIAISCFLSSVVFILKDKRWILLLSLLIDTWCWANLIYIRTNNLYLDVYALSMADNMDGFWGSIFIFFEWKDSVFYLLSIAFSILLWYVHTPDRHPIVFAIILAVSLCTHYIGEKCHISYYANDAFVWDTFSRKGRSTIYGVDFRSNVELTSILHSPLYIFYDFLQYSQDKNHPYVPTDRELRECSVYVGTIDSEKFVETDGLIIILVESLENWVVRPDIMPVLANLLKQEHVLYADKIKTQTIGAESADGQMLVNTGLLPVSEGATCFRFPFIKYPSLMHNVSSTAITILPHETDVWNQTIMSPAYGYDTTMVCSEIDTILFQKLNDEITAGIKNIQCITMSTHSPFSGCKFSKLQTPENMPNTMSDYIRAFNALDNGMSQFVERIGTDTLLSSYTIVITGDHRIFHQDKRDKFIEYATSQGFDYSVQYPYTPLIIYSPQIEGNIYVKDECYQMDIFPTILHLIGCENYYWHGFGVNLLDEAARNNRPITEKEAFRLSDLMIRSDYFRQYMHND